MDDMVPLKKGGTLPFLEMNQALQALRRVERKKPELIEELSRYVSARGNKDELRQKLFRELFDINESLYFFDWDEERDRHVMYGQMASVLRSALAERGGKIVVIDPVERI